jgi:hypothetical protein
MTPAVIFSLATLALFSLADLRYRTVPGAAVFFLASVLIAVFADPIRVGLVVLAVGWGWLRWPSVLIIPALFSPSAWAVLLMGAGVRRRIIGEADLLVLGGIACLFGWPATVLALVGVEVWRRMWKRPRSESKEPDGCPATPAIPGVFLGLVTYVLFLLFLHSLI